MVAPVSSKSKSQSKGPSVLAKSYLIAYNTIQTLGWGYLLYQLVAYHLPGNSPKESFWETVKWSVIIFQNGAILEVVHAIVGLVPSNVMVTLMQVYSRVYLVWGVFLATEAAPAGFGLPLALLAWCITEIIRYGYYAANLVGKVPHFLVFLRYTLFIALYPIGVSGELICLYHAQQEVGANQKWSFSFPNSFNFLFNYQYFILFYMFLYIPLFPMLYGHMFTQRKKILGGGNTGHQKTKKAN